MRTLEAFRVLGILLSLQLFASAGQAQESRQFECPPEVPEGAMAMKAVPAGWVGHVGSPLKLQSAGVMGSEPAKLVDLVPTSRKEGKFDLVETWDLGGSFDEGKWLACSYAGNLVTLAKRLPDNVARCSVTYQKATRQGPQRIAQIRCELAAD